MDVREELDRMTHEYLAPSPDRKVDQTILQFVSDFVISRLEGDRVLELGVGDQVWTPKLVEIFREVVTVDGSRELLAAMERKLSEKRWTPVCTLFEDYVPERRFDSVIATYVLEHVDDPLRILKLARTRWLHRRGKIAIVVPHALSLHRRLAVKMGLISHPAGLGDTDRRVGHKRCFTCHELASLVVEAGFRIVQEQGMLTKLLPNAQLVGCSEEQLRGMFALGLDMPIDYAAAIFILAEVKRESRA